MNVNSNIAIKLSDDDFRVKAFAEYCSRAQERYTNLLNAVSSISDYVGVDDDDPSNYRPLTDEEVAGIRERIKSDFALPSSACIALQEGYASMDDFLDATIAATHSSINGLTIEGDDYTFNSFTNFEVPTQTVAGNDALNNMSLSLAGIADQLQSNLHSITCMTAASLAYCEGIKNGTSAVLTIFNDKMGDVFANTHNDISSTLSYLKGNVLTAKDPNAFLTAIMSKIGISSEANDATPESYTPSDCDMSQFTGASPSCALDFSSTAKAVTTIAKTGAKVVAGIVVGVGSLIGGLFSKIVKKVKEITVDPNDLERLDGSDGFSTVDGFQYQVENEPYIGIAGIDPNVYDTSLVVEALNKYSNKWFAMKSKFAERMFRWTSVTWDSSNAVYRLNGITAIIKPRLINVDSVVSCLTPNQVLHGRWHSFSDVETFLDNVSAAGTAIYQITDDEKKNFEALGFSIYLESILQSIARDQMYGTDNGGLDESHIGVWSYANMPSSITNLDWVKGFSGYTGSGFSSLFPYNINDGIHSYPISFGVVWSDGLKCAALGLAFEACYPADQAPFVPFSNNHTDFNQPSYRIKTDNENKDAFNKFFTTAIVVAIVAIVAISAVVAIKKIAKARFFKAAQRQGELDNKMWNGGKLTKKERRQYLRSKRRVENSSLFNSNLISSSNSSSAPQTSDASVNLSEVVNLIK